MNSITRRPGRRPPAAVLALLLLASVSCTGGGSGPGRPASSAIRVASFDFVESRVVTEIYALAMERHGYTVQRFAGLGSREVVQPALAQGLVDFVPEYAGSALRFLDGAGGRRSPAAVSRPKLAAALRNEGVRVLAFSAAQDRNGVVVTAQTARTEGLRRISDLGPVAARLTFGGPPECPERPFCMIGLRQRYGLHFGRFQPMASRDVTVQALQTGEIDVGLLESTDPRLAGGQLVLLRDDRRLQPAENIVPLVRRSAVDKLGPKLVRLIDDVSARLRSRDLTRMNAEVAAGSTPQAAARRWLTRHALV